MPRKLRTLFMTLASPVLLQVGCLTGTDIQAIAEGQFISFVNALINAVTSDVLRAAI